MRKESSLSAIKASRREKILDAAEALFVERGYRATTMEAIADAASMSKATLYSYFGDKDAAFFAVAERLAGRLRNAVITAMERENGAASQIEAALCAKHGMVFTLVRRSAFAQELFAAKDQLAAQLFIKLDTEIEILLAEALRKEGHARRAAVATARLLFGAADGLAGRAETMEMAQEDIGTLVNAVLKDPACQ